MMPAWPEQESHTTQLALVLEEWRPFKLSCCPIIVSEEQYQGHIMACHVTMAGSELPASSTIRASVWRSWGAGQAEALLPTPGASHCSTASIITTFLLPSRRESWYFAAMAFGTLVCQEAARERRETKRTKQTVSSEFAGQVKIHLPSWRRHAATPTSAECNNRAEETRELPTQTGKGGKYANFIQISVHIRVRVHKQVRMAARVP